MAQLILFNTASWCYSSPFDLHIIFLRPLPIALQPILYPTYPFCALLNVINVVTDACSDTWKGIEVCSPCQSHTAKYKLMQIRIFDYSGPEWRIKMVTMQFSLHETLNNLNIIYHPHSLRCLLCFLLQVGVKKRGKLTNDSSMLRGHAKKNKKKKRKYVGL